VLNFKIWAFLALVFTRFSRGGRGREVADERFDPASPVQPVVNEEATAMPGSGAAADGLAGPDAGDDRDPGAADAAADGGAEGGMTPADPRVFSLTPGQIQGFQAAQGAVDGVASFIEANIGDLTVSIGSLLEAEFTAATVDPAARMAAMDAVAGLSLSSTEAEAVAAAEAVTGLVVANRIAIAENFAQILNIPRQDLLTLAAGIEADVSAGLGIPEGLLPAEQASFALIVAVQTNGAIVAALLNEANVTFDLGLPPFSYDAPPLPEMLTLDSLLATASASVAAVGALAVPAVANLQAIVDLALLDSGQSDGDAMAADAGEDMAAGAADDAAAGDAAAGDASDDGMTGGAGDDSMAVGDGADAAQGGSTQDHAADDAEGSTGGGTGGTTGSGSLNAVLATGGLLGTVTGNDALLGDVTGSEGLLGDLIGDEGALADLTGADGLVGDLLGTGLLGDGITGKDQTDPKAGDPVAGDPKAADDKDGAIKDEGAAEGGDAPGLLDPILADDGLLGPVTGNDGLLGEVTGSDGLLGDLIGNDGALADITGADGLVGDLLGTGLLGDDPILSAEAGLLDPIIADGGLLGPVTGNDGLLGEVTGSDGLLGDLIGNDGALADITGTEGLVGTLLGTGLLGGTSGGSPSGRSLLGALFQPRTIETMGDDPVLRAAAEEEEAEDALNGSLV
jgi:hypothetical protein